MYKKKRDVLEEITKIDDCAMEKVGTLQVVRKLSLS